MLAIVPFDLYTADSSAARVAAAAAGVGAEAEVAGSATTAVGTERRGAGPTLVDSIILQCMLYLADSGPTRDAAALCIAKMLTR